MGHGFFFQILFFSTQIKIGVPPDEFYHLKLSKIYSESVNIPAKDTEETYSLGAISRAPYLYHLIAGKVLHFFSKMGTPSTILRYFNVFLGILFFIVSSEFFFSLFQCKITRLLSVWITANVTMLTFLFGAISYDNLVNLFFDSNPIALRPILSPSEIQLSDRNPDSTGFGLFDEADVFPPRCCFSDYLRGCKFMFSKKLQNGV